MACLLLLLPFDCFQETGRPKCASACLHIWACCVTCVCMRACACEPSACSCLGHVWFLSALRPPPCSQALLQGPKITSLSMLPGLWNNNTPGFPITANPANGDGTENMCGQTGAGGGEPADGKGEVYWGYTRCSNAMITTLTALCCWSHMLA